MIRRTAPLVMLLCLGLSLWGCGEQLSPLRNGEPAPSFTLETLDRTELRFPDDLAGKVVAIRFWADWCPFCESEMQAIEPVYRRHRDAGLVILAVNVRQDRDTARAFIDRLAISYATLLDAEGDVARTYGVLGLPTTFIVDRDGKLRRRIIGESSPELFEKLVGEVL